MGRILLLACSEYNGGLNEQIDVVFLPGDEIVILSPSLPTCLGNEKLHIFCNSFMWFLDGCVILHMHSVSLFSFVLIAVRRESTI